jgi:hypothetical protein
LNPDFLFIEILNLFEVSSLEELLDYLHDLLFLVFELDSEHVVVANVRKEGEEVLRLGDVKEISGVDHFIELMQVYFLLLAELLEES